MSASMAEVLAKHQWIAASPDPAERCTCGIYPAAQTNKAMAAHQAEVLAGNGYGKLEDAKARAYDKGYGHGKYDQKFHPAMSLSGTPRPEKSRRNPYRAATERGQHD